MPTSAAAERAFAAAMTVLMLAGWWLTARDLPDFVLPGPVTVLVATARFFTETDLMAHAAISFLRVAASVTTAMALAFLLAMLPRVLPVTEEIVERRILTFLNSFPSVGWAILAVIWFGISNATVVFIQVAIVLPFCLINLLEGFRQLDRDLIELGDSLTRNRSRLYAKLVLPMLMPFATAALRIAYGISWKVALVSELFGARSGLGYLLQQAQVTADAAMVLATCLVIVLLFGLVDRLVLRPLGQRYSINKGGV
jgi:ABC-type nitrate/sulfonate/bicarbonate transport system permease component